MFVTVDQLSLAYDEHGSGIPVLWVHGYPLNRTLWKPQLEGLADIAHGLALDLRGHGESQASTGAYSMDLLADDCATFLDALGIRRPVVLAGLSMGGYVCMAFCRRHIDRLAGIILCATRAHADSPEGKQNRTKSIDLAQERGVPAAVSGLLNKLMAPVTYGRRPTLVETVKAMTESTSLEGVVGDLLGMRQRPDSFSTLASFELPALILHGADDQIVPTAEAEQMHTTLPNSQLKIIPQAGHLLNLEQPQAFNTAVRGFLEQF
ncbi:MAG: alpha/beta fold hydrolase [Anaerolineales bacterium]|jgi:3-oxoadipate enol-lactonase